MISRRILCATVGALMVLGVSAAGPAQAAATDNGTLICSTLTGKLVSSTSGTTRHTWTDHATGAVKVVDWPSGGGHTSYGYHNSYWTLWASSSISSRTPSCSF